MIRIEVREINKWTIMKFRCPLCNSDDSFTAVTTSPYHCWNCGDIYPRASDMMRHVSDRVHYYKLDN